MIRTMTLTDFILARIAEAEAVARRAGEGLTALNATGVQVMGVEVYSPARVLAECKAKRRIVALHRVEEDSWGGHCVECAYRYSAGPEWPCQTLLHLASIYNDHPDFQPEWSSQ